MAWEIKGTTGSLDTLHIDFQSQVKAPKNPKLIREIKKSRKVISLSPFVHTLIHLFECKFILYRSHPPNS